MVSRYRPEQTIIVMSSKAYVIEQVALSFGCYPVQVEKIINLDDAIKEVRSFVLKNKLAKKGDKVVIVAGVPFGHVGGTNMTLVEKI